MEPLPRQPNVLFLKGVSLSDYASIEDEFDKKILETAGVGEPVADTPESHFDRIPAHFTTLGEWPERSNLRCWACSFTFDGRPWFAPTRIADSRPGHVRIGAEGCFCSASCAALFILELSGASSDRRWARLEALLFVYFLFTGVRVSHIPPAPRVTLMQEYGGPLSRSEFFEKLRELTPAAAPDLLPEVQEDPAEAELSAILGSLST